LLTFRKFFFAIGGVIMVCPTCILSSFLGGWVGGYFGINPPKHKIGKVFSALITANFVGLTMVVLSTLNISICGQKGIIEKVLRVTTFTFIMGTIYSIGVNYLLGRYVFPPSTEKIEIDKDPEKQQQDQLPPCCRLKNK
jgi:hypothetical protein